MRLILGILTTLNVTFRSGLGPRPQNAADPVGAGPGLLPGFKVDILTAVLLAFLT